MESPTEQASSAYLPRRVLLVENDVLLAINAEQLLLAMGVRHVGLAASVAEGQALCRDNQFDFALLDFDLGNETSIELARLLHAQGVPFVFATGFEDRLELPEDLRASPLLHKPYFTNDIDLAFRQGRDPTG